VGVVQMTVPSNDLTSGCGGHHPLAEKGWTTRKNRHCETEWIPPPHLDHLGHASTPSITPRNCCALTTTTLLSATQNARLDNPMTTLRNRPKRVIPR
jgi:hypothetical protein